MRIIVEPGSYQCQNMGDVAMLQVAVRRLRVLWPGAELRVVTTNAPALARYCPGVVPIAPGGRAPWIEPGRWRRPLLGALARSASLLARGRDPRSIWAFGYALRTADLVVIAGQGSMGDATRGHALTVLAMLALAQDAGIPCAMLGQGVGPLVDPTLAARARAVLPRVDLIALREAKAGLPLLRELGVPVERIVTTGDDAIALAYAQRPARLGSALGVNVRVSGNAGVAGSLLDVLRPVIVGFAERQGVPLVPVPIAFGQARDSATIGALLAGCGEAVVENGAASPDAVIARVGRCRLVVTGAYHAAVFALAQGVPAVCLAGSAYYVDKFEGLADQFGAGCRVVRLDAAELGTRLRDAMTEAWDEAPRGRDRLLDAACDQIASGHAAVARVGALIDAGASQRARRVEATEAAAWPA